MTGRIMPGWKCTFSSGELLINRSTPGNGYIIRNDLFNDYTNNSATFTRDINKAVFYRDKDRAESEARLLRDAIPGYPGKFPHLIPAHIEGVI